MLTFSFLAVGYVVAGYSAARIVDVVKRRRELASSDHELVQQTIQLLSARPEAWKETGRKLALERPSLTLVRRGEEPDWGDEPIDYLLWRRTPPFTALVGPITVALSRAQAHRIDTAWRRANVSKLIEGVTDDEREQLTP